MRLQDASNGWRHFSASLFAENFLDGSFDFELTAHTALRRESYSPESRRIFDVLKCGGVFLGGSSTAEVSEGFDI